VRGNIPQWERTMVRKFALGLAWALALVGSAARVDAGEKRLAVRSPAQYDDARGVAYSLSQTADDGMRMSGRAAELSFEKTSYRDGHFDLRITSGADTVSFAISATGTQVSRNGRTATLVAGPPTEQEIDQARALLVGSRAVKRFRQLAVALEQSDDSSPASHGVLIGSVLVHLLDGDSGAPLRIARRLAARRPVAALRRIRLTQDPMASGTSEDCWATYEERVNQAYNDFTDCSRSRSWWNADLVGYACSGVWLVRIEGYWFQYLRCSALY
jgi:hypothetical protein